MAQCLEPDQNGYGDLFVQILNGQTPEEFKHIFQPVSSMHKYQTRSSQNDNLHLPQINLKSTQGVKIWNDIPPKIRKADSIVTLKKQFKEHLMMAPTV